MILGVNELVPNHVDPTSAPASQQFAPRRFGERGQTRIDIALPFKQEQHAFLFWEKR